jgi:transposase
VSQEQLQRIKVIENAVDGRLSVSEAAALLNVSGRQIKRLKGRYLPGQVDWVYHGNQGRVSSNKTPEAVRMKILELAKTKYQGFNDRHFHEKLASEEQIVIGRETLRSILRAAKLKSPCKRRPRKYRSRRERRSQRGMMLLTDASRHDWLEGRGPVLTLIGFVDDATTEVPGARFQLENEDTVGYMRVLRTVVESEGIALSLYRDQHGTFQRNDKNWTLEEELAGRQFSTQLGRCLEELGIQQIVAKSPQAKGRIERLWRTFQDRLVSELRVAGAKTLEEANRVLERFLTAHNQARRGEAKQPGSAYRPVNHRLKLDRIFSLRYARVVGKDHVISFDGKQIQLPPLASKRGYADQTVELCHLPNGDLQIYRGDEMLLLVPAPPEAPPVRAQSMGQRGSRPKKKKQPKIYVLGGRPATAIRP